jgi:hypothetical protein
MLRIVSRAAFAGHCNGVAHRVEATGAHEVFGLVGVGSGFGCRVTFGNDHPERGFRIDRRGHGAEVVDIHIGQKMECDLFVGIRGQRGGDKFSAEVRAADTDDDDMLKRFAGRTGDLAAVNTCAEGFNLVAHAPDLGHHVLAVHLQRIVAERAGSRMQHGAFFRLVEHGTGAHPAETLAQ